MRTSVGKSIVRVDAFDKATGRAKYTDDLCDRSALVAKIVHSTVGNGLVTAVDTSEAEKIPGVVKVLTCFDVPNNPFPTAGHPWSTDPHHQDVADRLLLNRRVRYYGDDVAVVVAENEVAAVQAARAVKVSYEEYPVLLDVFDAMKEDATQLHEGFPGNILAHTGFRNGDYEKAIQEPGLIKVEGWYDTPTVQHCHIENHICFAYMEAGRVIVTASTQIPHIIRRIVQGADHQALHRRRLRQQAGRPLRAPVRLAHHPGGRPPGEAGLRPGGDLRLQPRPPRHPHPYHLLGPARRLLRRPEDRVLLQPGRLRLPRPRRRRQGHELLPPALPLRQCGGRLLDRVHQPARRRRHARLRHPPGHVRRREPHRRHRQNPGHSAPGVPQPLRDAPGLRGRLLQERKLLRHLPPGSGEGRGRAGIQEKVCAVSEPDRSRPPGRGLRRILVQHRRLAHLPGVELLPHGPQPGRLHPPTPPARPTSAASPSSRPASSSRSGFSNTPRS